MLAYALHMDGGPGGWRYVVEGSPGNPKPGLRADVLGKQVDLCWRPPGGVLDQPTSKPVAFKLGYLKTYGQEMGSASLSCSGVCTCAPATLSGREGGRPRKVDPLTGLRRTSLHHVENVILRPADGPTSPVDPIRMDGNASGCCIVSVRTAPPLAAARLTGRGVAARMAAVRGGAGLAPANASFKILSFFVGKGAAGTGRLHQQSVTMAGTAR